MKTELLQLIWALMGTLGFGILFRAPLRDLPLAAIGGSIAWGAFLLARHISGSEGFAYLAASIAVGLYAEILSGIMKRPATLFILCAIIPLVPGAGTYYTMFYAVSGLGDKAARTGFGTNIAAGGIAAGLAVASALARILWLRKPNPLFGGKKR